jgi:hypothetical protein
MQAIEFEAIAQNRLIRIPDEIPDGVKVRVLFLVDELKELDKNFENQKVTQLKAQLEQAEQDIALGRYVELDKTGIAKLFVNLKQRQSTCSL